MAGGFMNKIKDAFLEEEIFDDTEMETADFSSEPEYDDEYESGGISSFRNRRKAAEVDKSPNLTAVNGAGTMKMILFQPLSFEDSTAIVDNLRARKPVIVNMVDIERPLAQRIIDFMSGAVYALSGTIRKVSYGIFVIVPSNITIVGDVEEEK